MTIQESAKKLREAESLVAQLTGELRAIETQEKTYADELAKLGLTPDQVPAALAALEAEETRLQEEISRLTTALAGALS